jgi:hypothetical protein
MYMLAEFYYRTSMYMLSAKFVLEFVLARIRYYCFPASSIPSLKSIGPVGTEIWGPEVKRTQNEL